MRFIASKGEGFTRIPSIKFAMDSRSCGWRQSRYFGRPIVEAVWIEGPASHVAKTLPFGKIKLASLQLLGVPTKLLFRCFAFFHIETRSIPLNDVSAPIAKWRFVVVHPAVFPICATDPSFVFEDFSGCQAPAPLCHNPIKVFRVNESSPIPAAHLFQRGAQVFQPKFIEVIEVAVGPGGVYQRGNRIHEKPNIQRLGFPFWKGHGGHYMPFVLFPNLLEFAAQARPVSILSGAGMLARTLSDFGIPTTAKCFFP